MNVILWSTCLPQYCYILQDQKSENIFGPEIQIWASARKAEKLLLCLFVSEESVLFPISYEGFTPLPPQRGGDPDTASLDSNVESNFDYFRSG